MKNTIKLDGDNKSCNRCTMSIREAGKKDVGG